MEPPYRCHICGYALDEPPWGESGADPTYDICSCCGCEFGYDDCRVSTVRRYREAWIVGGHKWFKPNLKPFGWDAAEQTKNIPSELPVGINRDQPPASS